MGKRDEMWSPEFPELEDALEGVELLERERADAFVVELAIVLRNSGVSLHKVSAVRLPAIPSNPHSWPGGSRDPEPPPIVTLLFVNAEFFGVLAERSGTWLLSARS